MNCEIVSIGIWRDGGRSVFWPDVPIYACSNCDRHYFDPKPICPCCEAIMRREQSEL